MKNYYLPLVGTFCLLLISFGSIAEQDPPDDPGPGMACASIGYAQIGRHVNPDFNNVNAMFCNCEVTGWFLITHALNKPCIEEVE